MRVGVLKDIKSRENRMPMTPADAFGLAHTPLDAVL
jgi:alanine dehydrogenase